MSTIAVTAVALGVLAFALLGPVPAYLARARWTAREPRAALVLWQAVGLAAGLALLGAAAAAALAPLGGGLLTALRHVVTGLAGGRPVAELGPAHLTLLAVTVALGAWLAGVLLFRIAATMRARRRHRLMVDLVGRPWPDTAEDRHMRVLEHPAAAAYCLPGTDPRVVLTSGALGLLDDEELAAVLAHERAHLSERHDLVVLPFAALAVALPWLPGVWRARAAVAALVEMLADDRACAACDRVALASALARFGTAAAPAGALAATGGETLTRVRRLLAPPCPSRRLRLACYTGAAALLAVPTAALLVF